LNFNLQTHNPVWVLINFKITKLWVIFNVDHFDVKILTSDPGYMGLIHSHSIGKLYVSQNGKMLVKYCDKCNEMKFNFKKIELK
jgi:hypothetical protein